MMLAWEGANVCMSVSLCVLKAQEDMEVTGSEGKQDDAFPGTAEAHLPSASSPHTSKAPQQLWV